MTKPECNDTKHLNFKNIFLILDYNGCEYPSFMRAVEDENTEAIELFI